MKRFLLTILCVVLVLAILIGGGCVLYFTNQTKVNDQVNKLLDERISEYVGTNRKEFIASLTPVIGTNGNWWIGDTDTGCKVTVEGRPGMSAYAVAVANGYQGTETEWLNSLRGADGEDGQTPFIGDNGNWWIGTTDTGISAKYDDLKNQVDSIGQKTMIFASSYDSYCFNPNDFHYLVFHIKGQNGEWSSSVYLTEFLIEECCITGAPVNLMINSSRLTTDGQWVLFKISYINDDELKLVCHYQSNIEWFYVWGIK